MADPGTSGLVQSNLHEIAQRLREAENLDPEAQQALAEVLDELKDQLGTTPINAAQLEHFRASTSQLLRALERPHEKGLLESSRKKLDQAARSIESEAPLIAGLARRLMEALANIGI